MGWRTGGSIAPQRRRGLARPVALAWVVAGLALPAEAAPTAASTPLPPPPPPKAWVAVDADTGAVIDAGNEREPRRVASVAKVLTALVVRENLPAGTPVTVSERAASMPARKISLVPGEVWSSDDLMHSLLLVSANDAAVALAEATAGSLESFGGMLDRTAARLGLADSPTLQDPAGLDDEFSVGGGNLLSARDLAIATRAFLAYPEVAAIPAIPEHRFFGGDGENHRLLNHNRLLKTYPGAIGIKTGYTKRAGHSLIAGARRDGRTAIVVVLSAADPYGSASGLLDRVFATPVTTQAGLDTLPPVVLGDATEPATGEAPAPRAVSTPTAAENHAAAREASGGGMPWARDLSLLAAGGLPAGLILSSRRRRQRRALARTTAAARVVGSIEIASTMDARAAQQWDPDPRRRARSRVPS